MLAVHVLNQMRLLFGFVVAQRACEKWLFPTFVLLVPPQRPPDFVTLPAFMAGIVTYKVGMIITHIYFTKCKANFVLLQ